MKIEIDCKIYVNEKEEMEDESDEFPQLQPFDMQGMVDNLTKQVSEILPNIIRQQKKTSEEKKED